MYSGDCLSTTKWQMSLLWYRSSLCVWAISVDLLWQKQYSSRIPLFFPLFNRTNVVRHNVVKYGLQHRFASIDSWAALVFCMYWQFNSAGTAGHHAGEPPDSRTLQTCAKYGVPINHLARQVTGEDFEKFDFLLAMDTFNLEDLEKILEGLDRSQHSKLGKGIPRIRSSWIEAQLFGDYGEPGSEIVKSVKDRYCG